MSRALKKLEAVLTKMVGNMPGDELLPKLKEKLLEDEAFRNLFNNGDAINVEGNENITASNTPYLQLRHKNDSFPHRDGYCTGQVEARLILDNAYRGNYNLKRKLALLFFRYFHSNSFLDFFERVDGLRQFTNMRFDYNSAMKFGAQILPVIIISFGYEIDLRAWQLANPEIDWDEPLLGEAFNIDSYNLTMSVDDDSGSELEDVIVEEKLLDLEV